MYLVLIGLLIVVGGGALSLLTTSRPSVSNVVGPLTAVGGCATALIPVARVITNGQSYSLGPLDWSVPYGSIALELGPLSAWFALPILGLSAVAAIYGMGYMAHYKEKKALGPHWFFFNLLIASMVLVVMARNGILFLISWEVMSLASFFLVSFNHEQTHVREAARTYLIATHLGTACLLVMFALLGNHAGSLDFAAIKAAGPVSAPLANVLFVLSVIGFGTKAGFMPLHVWLPEAHPAAPSHVSAVMSGVMIKTGIYGILMTLGLLEQPPLWWGWLLIGIGLSSGVMGVVFALAQHDLKRLLAYHSVENIGIIALGLGIGVLGLGLDRPGMAVIGFAGGLLHVLNHAIFKGLLFLCAGAVIHATDTGDMDALGGLQKKMPWVAYSFFVGAVAICGLPPLNGFVSEFLLYLVSIQESVQTGAAGGVSALAVIGGLALIGGLAVACFTKAYGAVFLGNPRTEQALDVRPSGLLMRAPMFLLAFCCVFIGFAGPVVLSWMRTVLEDVTGETAAMVRGQLEFAISPLASVVHVTTGFVFVFAALILFRRWLLSGREVARRVTWDCGYSEPTARMQYTSSSYAQPITQFFASFLHTHQQVEAPEGLFPQRASLKTETPDVAMDRGYRPLFSIIRALFVKLHWIQLGRLNYYVLYIALTIIGLLFWFSTVSE